MNRPDTDDLSLMWDYHCYCEFVLKDVDETMSTMVAEPYVNHIPTMTGGRGYKQLREFYDQHFIPKLPPDTVLTPISRTVSSDTVVDEELMCFTHDCVMDFMLPGLEPTGRRVEIPIVAIVKFNGRKIESEHIHWDQGSVLVQLGLINPHGLPVHGVETAKKAAAKDRPFAALV